MRYVHSLWSKPMLRDARNVKAIRQLTTTLWCYASSVAYLKRLHQPIILFADEYAAEWLSYLPYDEIVPLILPDDAPTCLWAAGKFFALRDMELQDVHIDGDVFIKTRKLHERISYGAAHSDLIIQSVEDCQNTGNKYYASCYDAVDKYGIDFINGANNDHSPAYNCGLVGFNNNELKDLYWQNYMHCHEQIASNPVAVSELDAANCWLDLLFEQKNLFDIAKDYRVFNVLGTGRQAYISAIRYGYQHILGSSKWHCLDSIKRQLKDVDPKLYTNTQERLVEILESE